MKSEKMIMHDYAVYALLHCMQFCINKYREQFCSMSLTVVSCFDLLY